MNVFCIDWNSRHIFENFLRFQMSLLLWNDSTHPNMTFISTKHRPIFVRSCSKLKDRFRKFESWLVFLEDFFFVYSSKSNRLGLKFEKSLSSRKKWSKSPNSPSIREQDPFITENENLTNEKKISSGMKTFFPLQTIDTSLPLAYQFVKFVRTVMYYSVEHHARSSSFAIFSVQSIILAIIVAITFCYGSGFHCNLEFCQSKIILYQFWAKCFDHLCQPVC